MNLPVSVAPRCRFNVLLSTRTSLRIGGPADVLALPETLAELSALMRWARASRVPVTMLGSGTNLLVADSGVRGVVVHLSRGAFTRLTAVSGADGIVVRCGAAVSVQQLVRHVLRLGGGSLERLAGLPGTVGGAVVGNAQDMGRAVVSITVVEAGGHINVLGHDALEFSYRRSNLDGRVVAGVVLRFARQDGDHTARVRRALAHRRATQELQRPSAGCTFKNPREGLSAGALIDRAGLKGRRIGDAQVSHKHANFIVNVGSATAADVLALIAAVQRAVYDRDRVWLEPELRMVGMEEGVGHG